MSALPVALLTLALDQAPAAQTEAPSPAAAPARLIEGLVRARGSRDPIPGARVTPTVDGADGRALVPVVTDQDGRFSIPLPAEGDAGVVVTAPGYETQVVPVSGDGRLLIWLAPMEPEAIVVTADGAEREHVTATSLPRQMVLDTPGTYDDAVRLVQALPGVVQTAEYSPRAGFIAVRGTGPQDNRFFLDGIDVPYLFHFQQYASVIPTSLLEEITLYPSTFRPTWGGAVGAVVDARTRDFRPEVLRADVNVNLIMAGGSVEAPVGDYGTFAVGGRRSYLDRASQGSAEYTVWPIFWDYHVRYDHRLATGRRLGVFAYGAGDTWERYDLERGELDPVAPPDVSEVTVNQGFHAVGARCSLGFGQPYTSESVAAVVLHTDEAVSTDGPRAGIDHQYLYVRHDGRWRGEGPFELSVGGEVKGSLIAYQGDPRGGAYAWPEPVLPSPGDPQTVTELSRVTGGLYAELGYGTARGIAIKPGVRVDGDTLSAAVTADPRLTVILPIGEGSSLRMAAGLYHQFPDAALVDPERLTGEIGPTRAAEVAGGPELTVSGRLRFHVQAYYKDVSNLVETNPPGEADGTRAGVDGGAAGLEASARYHIRDHFFAWLSYAYAHTWRVDPVTAERYVSDFDQPHAVNLVAAWQPTPRWNLGVRYRLSSGLPYTEVLDAVFDAGAQTWVPLPGARNASRLPTYQKIDATVERSWVFDRWTLAAYAQAWYVVPAGNVLYPLYSYDYSEVQYVGGPGFIPLVGARGSL